MCQVLVFSLFQKYLARILFTLALLRRANITENLMNNAILAAALIIWKQVTGKYANSN